MCACVRVRLEPAEPSRFSSKGLNKKERIHEGQRLKHKRRALGLLVTTALLLATADVASDGGKRATYPSSKCLVRFSGSCFFALHDVHSRRSTI